MGTVNIISFPNMGITLQVNRVAFSMFGKDIYWYGIIIALGFVLATAFALWRAKRKGINPDNIFDLVLWGLPVSIICARIFYVIGDWSSVAGNPWKVFAIWEGGLAIYGGMIGAVIVGVTYCKVKKLSMGKIFDLCAPAIMIGQIIGRWGNFMNAEVFGGVTSLPWGMSINASQPVHPLFLYESLWMLVGFIALVVYDRYKKHSGEIFWLYVLWYGLGRIWMEGMRQPEFVLKVGELPISQATALITILAAIGMLCYLYFFRPADAGQNLAAAHQTASEDVEKTEVQTEEKPASDERDETEPHELSQG